MSEGGGFTIIHRDQLERIGSFLLARRSLGLKAFGLTLADLEPGDSLKEHDELKRDQEEVFFVLEGAPTIVIDGQEHPAPAGTLVRLDPKPLRNVVNHSDARATVLIASAPRASGYEPMGWA